MNTEEESRQVEAEASGPSSQLGHPIATSANHPSAAASKQIMASFSEPEQSLSREQNLYALITQLRQQKAPGSFAKAAMLVDLCRKAIASTAGYRFLLSQQMEADGSPKVSRNGETEAKREAAIQAAEARCRDVVNNRDFDHPLGDDTYGKSFEGAMDLLTSAKNFEERRLALSQLTQQGQLTAAYRAVSGLDGGPIYFKGKLLQGVDAREFQTAAAVYFLAGSDFSGSGSEDLRYLIACNSAIDCPSNPQNAVLKGKTDYEKARIVALAASLRDALTKGDIEIFLPPHN